MADTNVTIGRIVRFVETTGEEWAAVVTAVHSETLVSLQVFRLGDIVARTSVPFSAEGSRFSWHWPDRS